MNDLGRILVGLGLLLVFAGAILMLQGRGGFPLGRLPGDISYRGRNFSFFAPLGTSLALSLILSLLLFLFGRFRR